MTRLTPAQVAGYAARAGFTGAGLTRAVAVALAESGGNPRARSAPNHDKWHSVDRGLWQFNSHWHPEVSDAQAYDPAAAAAAAYRVSKRGTDWHEWSTWNNGAAAAMLPIAALGAASAHGIVPVSADDGGSPDDPWGGLNGGKQLGGGGLGGLLDGATEPLDLAKSALTLALHAGAWMADPHNWARVAMVVGGTGALIVGVYMLAQSGAAGSTAASTARTSSGVAKKAAVAAAL